MIVAGNRKRQDRRPLRARARSYVINMEEAGMDDVARVGGKNASLGELIRQLGKRGVRVPGGFIITADAYRDVLKVNGLDRSIARILRGINVRDLKDLARRGARLRDAIRAARLPEDLAADIARGYREMEKHYGKNVDVAVRSSATAEDLPDASFAGEHETYLGIRGLRALEKAVLWTMSSLYNDRAIHYRAEKGYAHVDIALSVGVQKMVRSDKGGSGVMFTCDTETGFRDVVLINATFGLGELIVQGRVTPDEYLVWKPGLLKAKRPIIGKLLGEKSRKMIYAKRRGIAQTRVVGTKRDERRSFVLSDEDILTLSRWGVVIEEHYGKRAGKWCPMDIEWAKDGETGKLYIVQARAETVQSTRDFSLLREYVLTSKPGRELARGISVGQAIVSGVAHVITSPKEAHRFKKGEVLVTKMTDPDWGPIMKRAAGIITDAGGRTSHAAIVSRELGIPAIVGAAGATRTIETGATVTIDVTGSEGRVYAGEAKYEVREQKLSKLPKTKTKLMLNIASPEKAFEYSFLPVDGVGLAREEFIIASEIGIHPLAILAKKPLPPTLERVIERRTRGWKSHRAFYVDKLAFGIARIAAAFHPNPVIVRFSDFKSNEYANLIGGRIFEPREENPMIGWRGASRYYSPEFREAFALECEAFIKVREEMGLENVIPMVPFCRTIDEAKKVLAIMKENGLTPSILVRQKGARPVGGKSRRVETDAKGRASNGVKVIMMCEVPSNVILADEFLDYFDGFSIGSNDLTQLSLGLDRDSGTMNKVGNENNEAVRRMIATVIKRCRARGKYSGICGQGPSDLPDFAEFLVKNKIESMSLNPDTVVPTLLRVAKLERKMRK